MGNKKLQVWLPLIFSMVLIGGMFFGFKLRENTPSGTGFLKQTKKVLYNRYWILLNSAMLTQ
jgi:carboxyl-terminal processing protease